MWGYMPVVKASESPFRKNESIPFGLPKLDKVTGGGVPRKYVTEFIGEAGTGKSNLAMLAVREAQKMGLRCFYADVERTFAFDFAEKIGVDLKKLSISYHDTAEQYLTEIYELIEKKKYDLFVLDSIGALEAQEDFDKNLVAKGYPALTLLIARFLRKIVALMTMNNSALIIVNHEKTDFMGGKRILGGKSLKFHKCLSIKLYHNGFNVKQGEEIIGKVVMAKIEKIKPNLNGIPWTEVKLQYLKEVGFSAGQDLLDQALDKGIITKQGNTHYFGEQKLGMISAVREKMKDPALQEAIRNALT